LAAGATAPQPTTPSTPFVSIPEAEKHTASLLASTNKNQQKPHTRTPGKVYNWDG